MPDNTTSGENGAGIEGGEIADAPPTDAALTDAVPTDAAPTDAAPMEATAVPLSPTDAGALPAAPVATATVGVPTPPVDWHDTYVKLTEPSVFLFVFPLLVFLPMALIGLLREHGEERRNRVGDLLRPASAGGPRTHHESHALDTASVRHRRGFAVAMALCGLISLAGFGSIAWQHLAPGTSFLFSEQTFHFASIGFFGGWFYAVTDLVSRVRARDPSASAALTVVRGMIAAPIMGGLVAFIPGAEMGGMAPELGAFVIGLYPNLADRYINQIARQFLRDNTSPNHPRSLLRITGITREDADRLAEEGITDVQHLANARPETLMLRTPFSLRRVLDWMDEATLYRYLTDASFDLRVQAGLTGAVDLVGRLGRVPKPEPGEEDDGSDLTLLAEVLGVKATTLWWIADQIKNDTQFKRIKRLYQSELSEGEEYVDTREAPSDGRPHLVRTEPPAGEAPLG